MDHLVIGLIGLAVTLLGTLVVSVWRFSALATTMLETVKHLKDDLDEVRKTLDATRAIPLLEQSVGHLKEAVAKLGSWMPRADSRIQVLESKVISLKEHPAIRPPFRSRPDPEELK